MATATNGPNPPVIIVTDELMEDQLIRGSEDQLDLENQHFPYDSSATSELEDEASGSAPKVSQTTQ